ncbi:MAG: heparinase, partial [Bacteroidales bacterium]
CEGKVNLDKKANALQTEFDGVNVKLQCFGPKGTSMVEEEGWRSTDYRKKVERTSVAFNVNKQDDKPVRYITIIYPTEAGEKAPKMDAAFKNKDFSENGLDVQVKVGNKKYNLNYSL